MSQVSTPKKPIKKPLEGWKIGVIVVAIVIVVVAILLGVLLGTPVLSPAPISSGSGSISKAKRTVLMPGGNLIGNSQIPANIVGDFRSLAFGNLPWNVETFPNSYFFASFNNYTAYPLYTICWSEFSFLNPVTSSGNGNLLCSGLPLSSATGIGIGYFGMGFNPNDTPLDSQIPYCGNATFTVTTGSPYGTVNVTLPGNLPGDFTDYIVFAQNTSINGTHNALYFNGGTVTNTNTIALGYTHLGNVQTGPGTLCYFVCLSQNKKTLGSNIIYANTQEFIGTGAPGSTRIEQNLALPFNIDNPVNSFTWLAFGTDPSGGGPIYSGIQQTSSTTINIIVTGPTNFTVNLFCLFGITSSFTPFFHFV